MKTGSSIASAVDRFWDYRCARDNGLCWHGVHAWWHDERDGLEGVMNLGVAFEPEEMQRQERDAPQCGHCKRLATPRGALLVRTLRAAPRIFPLRRSPTLLRLPAVAPLRRVAAPSMRPIPGAARPLNRFITPSRQAGCKNQEPAGSDANSSLHHHGRFSWETRGWHQRVRLSGTRYTDRCRNRSWR
jgi:hypothetical protein